METQTENTSTMSQNAVETDPYGLPMKVRESGVTYELCEFDKEGTNAGFKFYTKTFDTFEALTGHYSPDTIVTIINRQLGFALRQKASNSIPTDADAKKKALYKGGEAILAVDVASAKAYVPGERDLTSISGCEKKIRELLSEIKDVLRPKIAAEPENAESIEALINTKKAQAIELRTKMQELIAKSEDIDSL